MLISLIIAPRSRRQPYHNLNSTHRGVLPTICTPIICANAIPLKDLPSVGNRAHVYQQEPRSEQRSPLEPGSHSSHLVVREQNKSGNYHRSLPLYRMIPSCNNKLLLMSLRIRIPLPVIYEGFEAPRSSELMGICHFPESALCGIRGYTFYIS